jgi:hypothetical protein
MLSRAFTQRQPVPWLPALNHAFHRPISRLLSSTPPSSNKKEKEEGAEVNPVDVVYLPPVPCKSAKTFYNKFVVRGKLRDGDWLELCDEVKQVSFNLYIQQNFIYHLNYFILY